MAGAARSAAHRRRPPFSTTDIAERKVCTMQFLRFKIEKMSMRGLGGVAAALTPCPAFVGLIQLLID
jgi:hypothetical protein